jgi:hypothetical protein
LIEEIKDVEVAWYIDGNYETYDSTTIMDIIEEQPKLEDEIINELEALKKYYEDTSEEWIADGEFQMVHAYSDRADGVNEAIKIVKKVCGIKTEYDEEALERIKGGYVYETTEEMLKDIVAVSEQFKEECKAIRKQYRKIQGE